MNQLSLDEFERDLYAAAEGKDGLIIDVRNNGGVDCGSIAWWPTAAAGSCLYGFPACRRGLSARLSARPTLHSYNRRFPITMLANEKSFSNAEMSGRIAFKISRGHAVGETTNGGVISTGRNEIA